MTYGDQLHVSCSRLRLPAVVSRDCCGKSALRERTSTNVPGNAGKRQLGRRGPWPLGLQRPGARRLGKPAPGPGRGNL